MLFMIVEKFKSGDAAAAVYERFREKGRLAPAGVEYISSWVDEEFRKCFQLMETSDRELLDEWISNWDDLVDFEVYQVMTSEQAAEKIRPKS